MSRETPGLVSVVLVNFEAPDDTLVALEGLGALEWPRDRLEVVVVDNASTDDSASRLRAALDDLPVPTKLVARRDNTGFAGGCNHGAEAASGEYVAFLNNDARPDAAWVSAAVAAFETDGSIACVASKVLDWEGNVVDFVDAGAAFYGHGFKLHAGEPDTPDHDRDADVLFASGAAMFVRRSVFRAVGGFDERYFLFFEDVDLGWRLWVLGHKVRYVPRSLAFHRHHATMDRFADWRQHYLLERNALFTIYKNFDDERLRTVLPAALALAVRRGVTVGGDDPHALDLERNRVGDDEDRIEISKYTAGSAYAVDAFVEALPGLDADRARIQAARRRGDHELLRLFRLPLFANIGDPYFVTGFDATVDALDVAPAFSGRRKILVATGDVLQERMAGPAIRAWQIALALSREHDVVLATTQTTTLSHPDFRVTQFDEHSVVELEAWCDVLVFQGHLLRLYPVLLRTNKIVVADIYDPFHLEVLEQTRDDVAVDRLFASRSTTDVLNEQLMRGDFFMCASQKQRDFWLGQLAGVGRINPATYDRGENLDELLAVVPFGVGDQPPHPTKPVLRGVVPGIGADDKILLWGGGIYNWFDPLTLLRAVDKLRRRCPTVRLFFMGLTHPNPQVGEMTLAGKTLALSDELGLTGTHVFFNQGWVPYEERQNYLLEADIGVSTHLDHVETAFSFRTRILDYIWAALPTVATSGDSLAALIEEHHIGLTVPAGDVDALEEALFRLLDDPILVAACQAANRQLAPTLRWSEVLRPLLDFCRDPRRAPDLIDPEVVTMIADPWGRGRWIHGGWRTDLRRALGHLRRGELGELKARVRSRVSRLRGRG